MPRNANERLSCFLETSILVGAMGRSLRRVIIFLTLQHSFDQDTNNSGNCSFAIVEHIEG